MKRHIQTLALVVMTLVISGCTAQATTNETPSSGGGIQVATETPTMTSATATAVAVNSEPFSSWVGVTDMAGYRYGIREAVAAFSPMVAGIPFDVSAPPGSNVLDLHIQVQNEQPDRPATYDLTMLTIAGPCDLTLNGASGATAPNGQCILGNGYDWNRYAPGQDTYAPTELYLTPGATDDLHLYFTFKTNYDYTTWTVWYSTCTGDGTLNCHLIGGKPFTHPDGS